MTAPDLVLATRLHLVKQNLAMVRNVIRTIESVREGLEQVLAPYESNDTVQTLRDVRNTLETVKDRANQDLKPLVRDSLDKLVALIARVEDSKGRRAAEDIRNRSGYLNPDVQETIERNLVREAERLEDAFSVIEESLRAPDADGSTVETAWLSFNASLPDAQSVFAEYVDFLAGVAVRDAGYDQGICQTADEMVQRFARGQDLSWRSLTIPTRRQYLQVPKARMVRLGFPEWSLWSVPLSAYVWASILVGKVPAFVDFVDALPEVQRAAGRVMLTDAVATTTMGPAYACALILLRLDATDSRPLEGALAQSRADTVLQMLEQMSRAAGEAGEDGPYTRVVEDLRRSWLNAPDSTAGGRHATTPPVADVVAAAHDRNLGSELGDNAWDRIASWADRLREGTPLSAEEVEGTDTPQTVLNAVWVARLKHRDQPVDTGELARRAAQYWAVVRNGPQRRGAGEVGGQFSYGPRSAP